MTTKKKQGTHLFIDTNVLLNFFAYSNDDLNELEKLVELLKIHAIKLYLTQQVVDEFYRNRDIKLSVSFKEFSPFGSTECPNFMASLAEYKLFKKAQKAYQKARKELSEKAKALADERNLLADDLFKRIAQQADIIPITDDAYAKATRRSSLGNPPGKSASLGDELNWELLLAHVPKGSDLHIITKDSDFSSKLNPTQPKEFLADEWKAVIKGNPLLA